jgi:hypothetical protein
MSKGLASQAEIDAAIEWYERGASDAAKTRGADLLRPVETVLACSVARMAAYAAATREHGLTEGTVRRAVAEALRFPEYARLAALTPKWAKSSRPRFVDTVPGLADFIRGTIIERQNLIRTAAVARIARIRFDLGARHRRAIEQWTRDFRA